MTSSKPNLILFLSSAGIGIEIINYDSSDMKIIIVICFIWMYNSDNSESDNKVFQYK